MDKVDLESKFSTYLKKQKLEEAMLYSKVFEMRTIGNRDWQWPPLTNPVNILEWNHFCVSYSVDNRHMKMVHNGNMEVRMNILQYIEMILVWIEK